MNEKDNRERNALLSVTDGNTPAPWLPWFDEPAAVAVAVPVAVVTVEPVPVAVATVDGGDFGPDGWPVDLIAPPPPCPSAAV